MSEANKQVVRSFNEQVIGRGNFAAIYQLLAPNFVDHTPMAGMPPNRDGVRKLFAMLRTGLPDLSVELHDQIAEGDKVVTRKTLRGTHNGELMGVAPTGKRVEIAVTDLLRVQDGKLVEHWGIADLAGLMVQLGVLDLPA